MKIEKEIRVKSGEYDVVFQLSSEQDACFVSILTDGKVQQGPVRMQPNLGDLLNAINGINNVNGDGWGYTAELICKGYALSLQNSRPTQFYE